MKIKDLLEKTKARGFIPYEKHVSYCEKYADFLYSKDTSYLFDETYTLESGENGEVEYKSDKKERRLLNTHKYICGLFANLLFSERTELKLDGVGKESTVEKLQKFYYEKGMWQRLEKAMFEVFGVGTVALCVYNDNLEGLRITQYSAFNIIPLTIVDDEIKDVCFRSVKEDGSIVLNIYIRNLVNRDTVQENAPIIRVKEYRGYTNYVCTFGKDGVLKQEIESVVEKRPFVILKGFEMGTADYTRAIGKPVYWDSLDILKVIDNQFNLGNDDAESSKKQTLVNDQMIKDPITKKLKIPRSLATAHFISVNGNDNNSSDYKNFIHTHAPQMIVGEYYKQVEWNLKILSQRLHLGANELTIDKILAPTATQVISNNTEKYGTIKKHLQSMYNEFTVFNSAILSILGDNSNAIIGFSLDDGVIEDRASIIERAKSEVESGLMSVEFYLSNVKQLQGDELTKELDLLGYDADGKKRQVEPIAPIIELSEE